MFTFRYLDERINLKNETTKFESTIANLPGEV